METETEEMTEGHPVQRYVLNEQGEPVLERDLLAWSEWMEDPDHLVLAHDDLGPRGMVLTVFLGMDARSNKRRHGGHSGPPLLWETTIQGGLYDDQRLRYPYRSAALAGHQEMVRLCKGEKDMERGTW